MTTDTSRDNEYKAYRRGTHRTVEPRATLAKVRPHLRAMGITRIANVTGLDRLGLPVVTACRPNARSLSVSQGKGLELDAAKASAVMESIELYHAEHITAPLRCGSAAELDATLPLVDVCGLPRSSTGRFHDRLSMLWIEGFDMLDQGPRWVPLETVSVDYTLPLPPGSGSFAASSNGLASGNTRLEAMGHGICEVVERDAATLWKLQGEGRRRATAVAPESIDDRLCREALLRFEQAGVRVRIWDITSDVGIATFCCLAFEDDEHGADPELGAGCHPNREIALLRALTEAAQARTTFIAGSRDDLGHALYTPAARRRRRSYCRALIGSHEPQRDFRMTPTLESDSLETDVDWMLSRVRSVGIEQVVVVDLSRADFNVPVVRVIIPGLEGAYGHEQGDCVPGRRAQAVIPFGQ